MEQWHLFEGTCSRSSAWQSLALTFEENDHRLRHHPLPTNDRRRIRSHWRVPTSANLLGLVLALSSVLGRYSSHFVMTRSRKYLVTRKPIANVAMSLSMMSWANFMSVTSFDQNGKAKRIAKQRRHWVVGQRQTCMCRNACGTCASTAVICEPLHLSESG